MGVRNGRIFHPGVFWGVRKWRILCFISANSPSGVGGRFFARGVRFFELPGIRKGGSLLLTRRPSMLAGFALDVTLTSLNLATCYPRKT